MATIEIALSNVSHIGLKGAVTPVLKGRAKHLALDTTADAGVLQDGAGPYVAPNGGAVMVFRAPVALWLRVFRPGDDTAAGSGAAWEVEMDERFALSLEPGDMVKAAVK